MKSAPTIAFDYRPSRQLGVAGLALAAVAVLACWLAGLPWWLRLSASLAALAFAAHVFPRFLRPRFRRIAWRSSGWTLVDANGHEHTADLCRHMRFGAWLLALEFRHGPRSRFHAVIAPDNVDADTRRRLILLLKRADVLAADGDRAA